MTRYREKFLWIWHCYPTKFCHSFHASKDYFRESESSHGHFKLLFIKNPEN